MNSVPKSPFPFAIWPNNDLKKSRKPTPASRVGSYVVDGIRRYREDAPTRFESTSPLTPRLVTRETHTADGHPFDEEDHLLDMEHESDQEEHARSLPREERERRYGDARYTARTRSPVEARDDLPRQSSMRRTKKAYDPNRHASQEDAERAVKEAHDKWVASGAADPKPKKPKADKPAKPDWKVQGQQRILQSPRSEPRQDNSSASLRRRNSPDAMEKGILKPTPPSMSAQERQREMEADYKQSRKEASSKDGAIDTNGLRGAEKRRVMREAQGRQIGKPDGLSGGRDVERNDMYVTGSRTVQGDPRRHPNLKSLSSSGRRFRKADDDYYLHATPEQSRGISSEGTRRRRATTRGDSPDNDDTYYLHATEEQRRGISPEGLARRHAQTGINPKTFRMPPGVTVVKQVRKSVSMGHSFDNPMPIPFHEDGVPNWDGIPPGRFGSLPFDSGPLKGKVVVLLRLENGRYVISPDGKMPNVENRDKDKAKLRKETDELETSDNYGTEMGSVSKGFSEKLRDEFLILSGYKSNQLRKAAPQPGKEPWRNRQGRPVLRGQSRRVRGPSGYVDTGMANNGLPGPEPSHEEQEARTQQMVARDRAREKKKADTIQPYVEAMGYNPNDAYKHMAGSHHTERVELERTHANSPNAILQPKRDALALKHQNVVRELIAKIRKDHAKAVGEVPMPKELRPIAGMTRLHPEHFKSGVDFFSRPEDIPWETPRNVPKPYIPDSDKRA